jgi:hypothetical protein
MTSAWDNEALRRGLRNPDGSLNRENEFMRDHIRRGGIGTHEQRIADLELRLNALEAQSRKENDNG